MARVALRIVLASIVVLGVPVPPAARADEPKPAVPSGRVTLATEAVIVFKDDYALVVKGAVGTADATGRVHTEKVPSGAVLGCVWAATGKDERKVLSMRSEWVDVRDERSRETPCSTVLELLRANAGKKVVLTLAREKDPDSTVSGTLVEVLEVLPEPPPRPSREPAPPPWAPNAPSGGTHVVLEGDGGRVVLPVAEIRTVRAPDLVTKTTRKEERASREKRLSFDFGADAAGKQVGLRLLYFTSGFRWIPTYRVTGGLVADADLALQGEILNDCEDVTGADWSLVVGVPNFRFKDTPSPLALEAAMRQVLERASDRFRGQRMAQNFLRNDAMPEEEGGGAARGTELAPGLAATGEQDLFVYSVGKLSLDKGARAALPLWNATVPLRHLYTFDSGAGLGWKREPARAPGTEPGETASPLRLSKNETWHQLELQNGGTMPWTTGPALLLRGNLPLGQDMLTYTPVSGKALLPVTIAVDVRSTYDEQETDRVPQAMVWGNRSYSLIKKAGTLKVTNYRKEPAAFRATLTVVGKTDSASDGGAIRNESADDVNVRSRVVWEATIAPGETLTRTVSLSYYVP